MGDVRGAASIDNKHALFAEIAVEGRKEEEEVKAPCRVSIQGRGLRRGVSADAKETHCCDIASNWRRECDLL